MGLPPRHVSLALGNLSRQALSAILMGRLVRWKRFGAWVRRRAAATIPVAAGSAGMGCIGFPYHPVWEVTRACNLGCIHCHATSGQPEPDELTTDEGRRLIDQIAAEPRFRMLVFTGGEPLVRTDLFDLLARARDRGLVNVIATNGTLIDGPAARELRRLNVRGVAISLDHTEACRHNQVRGDPQAFDRAMAGMAACREAGIALQVNFTAMPDNLDNVAAMMRLCEGLGAAIVLCYQVVPMGRGAAITALGVEQNRFLLAELARLQSDLLPIVEPVAAPQYWAHLLNGNGRHSRRAGAWTGRVFHGCTAGWGLVYIKPNGDVWPCPFVPVSGGNVRRQALGEVWRKGAIFQALRNRDGLKGSCGSCEHRSICGGCRGKAFAATGDPLGEDPSCFLRR